MKWRRQEVTGTPPPDPHPSVNASQIWDTAGQEKYHSLAPMYYRGAGAAIVVYDITKMHSFRTLKEWINELQAQGPQDIAIAIAGNKRDLESQRVSQDLIEHSRVSFVCLPLCPVLSSLAREEGCNPSSSCPATCSWRETATCLMNGRVRLHEFMSHNSVFRL